MTFTTRLSLFGIQGERKYLNQKERDSFYTCAMKMPLEKRLFCQILYYTGARISEVYELSPQRIDFVEKTVIFRTLKRRRNDVYRQIPLPDHLLGVILAFIDIRRKKSMLKTETGSLWSFAPRTGSRLVKHVMTMAEIEGAKASALGLRHGFAVHAVTKVPLTQVQKWMGHSRLTTTAIYLEVSGVEERKWAEKMW